jgi:hypothetical protein
VVLALAVSLMRELGLPTSKALAVADRVANNQGRYLVPQGLTLTLDLTLFRSELLERLERAVEIAPVPKRGRPPKSKTGRLD